MMLPIVIRMNRSTVRAYAVALLAVTLTSCGGDTTTTPTPTPTPTTETFTGTLGPAQRAIHPYTVTAAYTVTVSHP